MDFIEDLIATKSYRRKDRKYLLNYFGYANRPTSEFDDKILNGKSERFKESLLRLENFIIRHLFVEEDRFSLHPELRSERAENHEIYRESAIKLEKLSREVGKEYVELVKSFSGEETEDNGRLLFFKEGSGEFLCGAHRESLVLDTQKPYYKTFVAIYLSAGGNGKTTVPEIRRSLRSRSKQTLNIERKDVQNHINSSIKRALRGKIENVNEVFKWEKGKNGSLFFNNPKL